MPPSSQSSLPPFEGNPLKAPPPGAHLRVWTQAGGHEYVGRFSGEDRFTTDDGRMSMSGVGYCRIEDADTGEVYYDNGWYR